MECPAHLVYVSDSAPGYRRQRRGRGFCYLDANQALVCDPAVLRRIEALVIPPMWEQVWICALPDGHLQATGLDQKRRKQYLYHPDWTAFRQSSKFARINEFGQVLPRIRRRIINDLKRPGWPKEKVLALVVKLLDELHLRVGNECYRDTNETFGLTTLRRKHLKDEGERLRLEFKGKSGRYRQVSIKNPGLIKMVRETSQLPGYELFRYLEDGVSKTVDSRDVNDYIHAIAGTPFSAKDFRTWGGTTLAIEKYPEACREVAKNPRRKLETALVRAVAQELGNTLSVCREYYIHPDVLGVLVRLELDRYLDTDHLNLPGRSLLRKPELIALNILEPQAAPAQSAASRRPDSKRSAATPRAVPAV